MGWFNSLAHDITHAAETVAHDVSNAASTVVNKVEDAASTVSHAVTNAAEDAWSFTKNAVNTVENGAVTAWEDTSQETQDIAHAVESAGITIGNGFMTGANDAMNGLKDASEVVYHGLVAAGSYISSHACDIGVGSALSAVFAALAADGEEEAAVGGVAAIAATQTIDNAALNTAAATLANIIAIPVYKIPGVSGVVGSQSELTSIISFLIFKAVKDNPKMVVSTAGQYLAGALIYGLTSVICEGTLPGGYQVWKGAQNVG